MLVIRQWSYLHKFEGFGNSLLQNLLFIQQKGALSAPLAFIANGSS